MSEQENLALIRRGWGMINERQWEALEALHAADWVYHAPGGQGLFSDPLLDAFPDLQVTIEDLIASGDEVVSRFTIRGTHRADFQGIAPTGKQIAISGIGIHRIEGGKVAEDWEEYDRLGLMQQIGAIP